MYFGAELAMAQEFGRLIVNCYIFVAMVQGGHELMFNTPNPYARWFLRHFPTKQIAGQMVWLVEIKVQIYYMSSQLPLQKCVSTAKYILAMIYYKNVATRNGPLQQFRIVLEGPIHMTTISKGDQNEDRINKCGAAPIWHILFPAPRLHKTG